MDVTAPLAPANLVEVLDASALARPDDVALIVPGPGSARHVTRGELRDAVGRLAAALAARGVERGDRVVVMLPLSPDLYVTAIAVLRLAATAVLVEPGLGLRHMARACDATRPKAFIGTAKAHVLRLVSRAVRAAPVRICAGARLVGAERLEDLLAFEGDTATVPADDATPAAISYTSGTTGLPKEIERTHRLLWAQHRAIAEAFPQHAGDVGLSALPMFVLHDLASGTPALIPRRDGRAATLVDARAAVGHIEQHRVTIVRGAPRFYARIADECESRGISLPSVRALFVGGAPVATALLARLRRLLPNGSVYVVYGCTEAEPIAAVDAAEVLASEITGTGACVGRAVGGTRIRVVADGSSASLESDLSPRMIGEVAVAGPHVRATHDGWLHTGDAAYRDEAQRLWVVGRVADRVVRAGVPMYPLQVEPLIDDLPFVERSALIGVPDPSLGQRAVVVVATRGGLVRRALGSRAWRSAIVRRCADAGHTVDEVRLAGSLPLDRRHRSKVLHDVVRARHGGG